MAEAHASVDRIDVEAVNAKHKRSLYAARVKVFPKRVQGTFRRLKWWIMAVTLGIYYVTPWLRWDRGPHAPDQAVLVDMVSERFYFFFDDPAARLDGICIYLDGMSAHVHGNPATLRRDRQIREELRHRGYEVFEIPFGHLTDRGAMARHFYRLGRIMLGRESADRLRTDPGWFG